MKKVFLAIAVVAAVACFSSCKKNCVCNATYTIMGETMKVGPMTIEDQKNCDDVDVPAAWSGFGASLKMDCKAE